MGKTKKILSLFVQIILVGVIILSAIALIFPKSGFRLECTTTGAAIAQLRSIECAVMCYDMDNLHLPDSLDDLTVQTNNHGPYLKPRELIDPWGQEYQYSRDEDSNGFTLFTVSPKNEVLNRKSSSPQYRPTTQYDYIFSLGTILVATILLVLLRKIT